MGAIGNFHMSNPRKKALGKSIFEQVKARGREEGYLEGAQVAMMKLDEARQEGFDEAEASRAHWSIYPGFMCIGAILTAIFMGYFI